VIRNDTAAAALGPSACQIAHWIWALNVGCGLVPVNATRVARSVEEGSRTAAESVSDAETVPSLTLPVCVTCPSWSSGI
jgi:hypothetical protein